LSHFDKGDEGTGVLSSNVHGEASPVYITCGHFDMKEVRMMMIEPEDKTLNKCIIFILSTFRFGKCLYFFASLMQIAGPFPSIRDC
jgi:hypothetical protein